MRKLTRTTLAATAVAGLLAIPAAGAGAEDQVITGTVGSTVTIDSTPAAADLGTLPVTAASIGSISVNANGAYLLTAQPDNATMTVWDGSVYGSDALASPMTLFSSPSAGGGTGLPAGGALNTATPTIIGSNALSLLVPTIDTYDLSVSQPATALDTAGSYRMVVTYTAALDL